MSRLSARTSHPDDRGLDPGSELFADDVPVLPPARKQLPTRVLGALTLLSVALLALAAWSSISH